MPKPGSIGKYGAGQKRCSGRACRHHRCRLKELVTGMPSSYYGGARPKGRMPQFLHVARVVREVV